MFCFLSLEINMNTVFFIFLLLMSLYKLYNAPVSQPLRAFGNKFEY